MQLKNDFFLHLFSVKWPYKLYNFQMCLCDDLLPRMLEMAFQSFQISKFSEGACPKTPPRLRGLMAPCSYSWLLFSNQLPTCTSNFIKTPCSGEVLFGMCPKSPQQTYKMPQIEFRSLQSKKMKTFKNILFLVAFVKERFHNAVKIDILGIF